MMIRQGDVSVDGEKNFSCSLKVTGDSDVQIAVSELDGYVSRSALKLKYFLDSHLELLIEGKTCLDIGASTGGFTQVLLERGAARVYALDVGRNQLDPKLKEDERIVSMEGLDVRDIFKKQFRIHPPRRTELGIITVDVSFISLTKIFDAIASIVHEFGSDDGVDVILLWKPQFEVGRAHLTKKGVVKSQKIRSKYLQDFLEFLQEKGAEGIVHEPSLVHGEEGNVEEVIYLHLK